MKTAYQTGLSDVERAYLEPHLPDPKAAGRPETHARRESETVHHYFFGIQRIDGTREKPNAALRERLRIRSGRNTRQGAGIVAARSAARLVYGWPGRVWPPIIDHLQRDQEGKAG